MNPKIYMRLFNGKGKAPAGSHQGISTLVSAVALCLVILAGYEQTVQASDPGGQPSIEELRAMDPADRKFFIPGYGTFSGVSKEAEVLPAVDPADRKFFNPGYGAQPIGPGEDKVLSATDPADRKFFTPGYGAQPVTAGGTEVLPAVDPADRKFFNPGYGTISAAEKN